MATTLVQHEYVDGATVTPANGTVVTIGSTITVTATPTDPANPPTLFLIDGVDYSAVSTIDILVLATGVKIAVTCAQLIPNIPSVQIRIPHVVPDSTLDYAPQQPSSLIFPSGTWMFSMNGLIGNDSFSIAELMGAPVKEVGLGYSWAKKLYFEDIHSYGMIDGGIPIYVDEIRDFGGGQVARWKKFVGLTFPWKTSSVTHLIGWIMDQDMYDGSNPFLNHIFVGVNSWSQDAVTGGVEIGFPTSNRNPQNFENFGFAVGVSQIPWDFRKKAVHEPWVAFARYHPSGYIYVNTPQGPKRLYHLYHVIEVNSTIRPAHGTLLLEGSSVAIFTKASANNVLDLFTVDSVDRLTGGSVDIVTGENYYIKTNVNADVYVSSSAQYDAPDAIDGTPYSFQCTCPVCGTTTWSATGLPTGLTINAATGLISGTVPYDTAAADYTVTVTAVNNGNTVSRTFTMSNTFVTTPIPGVIWEAITKLDSSITAMVQIANGDVLIGTDANKIYSTSDFVTFTPVFTSAATISKITLLSTGRLIALGNGVAPDCAAYSDDNGANWTKVSVAGEIYRDGVELSPTLFVGAGGDAGSAYTMSSTDAGLTYAGWWSFYNVGLLNGFSKVIKFDATSLLALRDRNEFMVIKCSGGGALGDLKYTIAGSDGTNPSCNFVKRSDGQFLFGAYNELHIGTADGETWALHKTLPDWGGLATPGIAYSMCSEPAESAVWVAVVGGLGITHVLRSVDDGANFVASVTDIDGAVAPVMIQLANRDLILGTNGTTNNLWKSEA